MFKHWESFIEQGFIKSRLFESISVFEDTSTAETSKIIKWFKSLRNTALS